MRRLLRLGCCEEDQRVPTSDPALAEGLGTGTPVANGAPPASQSTHLAELVGALMKALADPTRLQILSMLVRGESPLCVCEIELAFDLSQPTISHHLRVLRDAGLVRTEKRGLWVYYSPVAERLEQLRDGLALLMPEDRRAAGRA